MIRIIALLVLLALLACLAACGEPSAEELEERMEDLEAYEVEVEGMLNFACQDEERIEEILYDWEDLEEEYDLRDGIRIHEMEDFLDDFEDILERLEDAAKDLC